MEVFVMAVKADAAVDVEAASVAKATLLSIF